MLRCPDSTRQKFHSAAQATQPLVSGLPAGLSLYSTPCQECPRVSSRSPMAGQSSNILQVFYLNACIITGSLQCKSEDKLIHCKIMAELDHHFPLSWLHSLLLPICQLCNFCVKILLYPFQSQKFPSTVAGYFWGFLEQLGMDCWSERCQNYWSTFDPFCFQWQDKSKQPQVKSLRSRNPSYAHICCYQYVQPDRCIFLSLWAISICMVMRPSKGIQQVRLEMNSFHQHHLVTSSGFQEQEKLQGSRAWA